MKKSTEVVNMLSALSKDLGGDSRIIPFGKYKGQSLEVLRQDQGYMDWLAAQDGIRQQYPWIFSITVNTGAEPAETPEHNRYQAMFLDRGFANDVFDYLRPGVRERDARSEFGHHERLASNSYRETWVYHVGPVRLRSVEVEFEVNGKMLDTQYKPRVCGPADVELRAWGGTLRIEIKPQMGDDYPAVLRQMKANNCNVLYLVNYSGAGATLNQVKQIFSKSGIRVLIDSEFWVH